MEDDELYFNELEREFSFLNLQNYSFSHDVDDKTLFNEVEKEYFLFGFGDAYLVQLTKCDMFKPETCHTFTPPFYV